MNRKKTISILTGILLLSFGSGLYAAKQKVTEYTPIKTVTFCLTLKNGTNTTFKLGKQNLYPKPGGEFYSTNPFSLYSMEIVPKDGQTSVKLSPGNEARVKCILNFYSAEGKDYVTSQLGYLPIVKSNDKNQGKGSECQLSYGNGGELGIFATSVTVATNTLREYDMYYPNHVAMGEETNRDCFPLVLFYLSKNQSKFALEKISDNAPFVQFNDPFYCYGNTVVAGVNYFNKSENDISMNEPTLCIVPAEDANAVDI